MSETLGSLRVAINLDNSGMDRPLKEIKAGLKATQEQFKASMLITESLEDKTESLGKKYQGLESVLKQQAAVALKQEQALETLRNSENVSIETVKKAEAQYYQYIQAMRKTENEMIKTKKELDGVSKSEDKARVENEKLADTFQKNASKSSRFSSSLTAIKGGLVGVIATAGATAVGIGTIGLKFNADVETYQNTLSTILKSKEKASDMLAWAKQFSVQTPFELKDVVEATTKMEVYGISAKKNLGIVGDMASVMGKDLNQAVEAVADAQTGELERMKEFGIKKQDILDQLESMGVDIKKVVNKKMQITDQDLFNKGMFALMNKRFKGGMENQSKTFNGMMSNLKDNFTTVSATAAKPLFDAISNALPKINDALTKFNNMLTKNNTIGNFFSKIKEFFSYVTQNVSPVFSELKTSLGELWTSVSSAFKEISSSFQSGGGEPVKFKDIIVQVIKTVVTNITQIVKVITAVIEFIKPFLTDLAQFIGSVFAQIKAFWDENGAGIMEGIKIFVITITAIFETIWQFVSPVLTFLWTSVKALFQLGVNTIMNYIKIMTSFIRGDFKGVKEGVLNIISGMFTALDKVFGGYWDMVKGTLSTLVENIKGAFNIDLSQIGKDMINGLIGGIDSVMDTLKTKIEGMGDKIPDWLKKKLGIKSPSRVLAAQIGRHLPTGIALGIDQSMPKLHTAVQKMGQATIPALQGNSFQGTNSNSIHQTFSPSITINGSSNPYELVREQERLLKRLSFKGGY